MNSMVKIFSSSPPASAVHHRQGKTDELQARLQAGREQAAAVVATEDVTKTDSAQTNWRIARSGRPPSQLEI